MKSLAVNVARVESRSPVWVGRGLVANAASLAEIQNYSRVVVISDMGARQVTDSLQAALKLSEQNILFIEGGESCKQIQALERLWNFFVKNRLDRKALVFAVGGGAVSDLVGFAAATYMRGIAYIPIPTTLLAQVDASIGGKSGINFSGAKNILGAIRQPVGIIVDVDTLASLSSRDLRSGFAEIIKHGLIADRPYFELVTSRAFSEWNADELVEIIFRSCEIKRDVVEADESEQGMRKTLNFGHTLGHAIEALALIDGVPLTHGEAISIGMRAASYLSYRMGMLPAQELSAIIAGISKVGLPTRLPTHMDESKLLELMSHDKKNVAGTTRWTLLQGIGQAVFDQQVESPLIRDAIAEIQA